ncbi:uncharacterized protein RHIMIDRAFT_292374 [Rhizopus microsporus ATCC 52813]|uniref:Uncharacterized protein n=1 Tax=Rhizopus microsporus ATCC 52813 TaxID=1340429 RepID=A0A2G4SU21_RHIZD|nr:uncharacterized protein RHIMIDRAFT_292374 [Rhizopus microsporus ATCC 52813]PHZ12273.1 hypothetical protein RHIMIDRAFT_292374 [Rhizopus microsporus ATCC 52813]
MLLDKSTDTTVQRSAVVKAKEDETFSGDLFQAKRRRSCAGSMTIYTRANASRYSSCTCRIIAARLDVHVEGLLKCTSTDDEEHPTLEYLLVADVIKKYNLIKNSERESAGLTSFETIEKLFRKLHEELYPPPAIYQLEHYKLCPAANGQDIASTYP